MKKEVIMKISESLRILFIIFPIIFLTLSLVNAAATQLYCLEKGQTIEFSKCNPDIADKVCNSGICQICATEVSTGVFCPANPNNCNEACIPWDGPIETTTEQTQIDLISPSIIFLQEDPSIIDFIFKVSKPQTIDKCSLILGNESVANTTSTIRSGNNKISYLVPEGTHTWYLSCLTRPRYGSTVINSESRSISIGANTSGENNTEPPSDIILLNPERDYTSTGTQEIQFKYNFSENIVPENITQCDLIINDQIVQTTTSKITAIDANETSNETESNSTQDANGTRTLFEEVSRTISHTLSPGSYTWKILCKDTKNETISSNSRQLTIDSPPSNTGGGGGGGGGGGPAKKALPQNSTNSTIKTNNTIHLNKDTAPEPDSEDKEEIEETSTDKTKSPGITGAVIGNALKTYKYPVIIFIILIIIITIFVNSKKKSQDKAIKRMISSIV